MPRLKIDTKKSLYEPLEIEINGKVFQAKAIDRDILKKIRELDAETGKGNLDAAYQRLELLIGKHKFIDDLKLENLIEITEFVIRNIFRPTKLEKNSPGPGAKKLQP
jgi:hypothetical protein